MKTAHAFTDRIDCVPKAGYLSMSDAGNGDWKYRTGYWQGRASDGRGYAVQIATSGGSLPTTFLQLIHGQDFTRRWPATFTDRTLSRLARELVEDMLAGRIGAVGLNAR